MSGETTPVEGGGTTTPAAKIEEKTVEPVTPQPGDENQPWFRDRLTRAEKAAEERTRASLLQELGVDDPAKAKAAIEAARKAEEAAKSADQRLGETTKTVEALTAERKRLEAVVLDHASREIGALTEAQQAAVRAIAPDTDPASQLKAIDALKPTWVKATETQTTPDEKKNGEKPEAKPKAPASTAPTGGAPPPVVVTSENPKEIYAALQSVNPFRAAEYGLSHAREVFPEKP